MLEAYDTVAIVGTWDQNMDTHATSRKQHFNSDRCEGLCVVLWSVSGGSHALFNFWLTVKGWRFGAYGNLNCGAHSGTAVLLMARLGKAN